MQAFVLGEDETTLEQWMKRNPAIGMLSGQAGNDKGKKTEATMSNNVLPCHM